MRRHRHTLYMTADIDTKLLISKSSVKHSRIHVFDDAGVLTFQSSLWIKVYIFVNLRQNVRSGKIKLGEGDAWGPIHISDKMSKSRVRDLNIDG